jgi:farnesyl diphosphate synthase
MGGPTGGRLLTPPHGLRQADSLRHCVALLGVSGACVKSDDFESRLAATGKSVEDTLGELLAVEPLIGEVVRPAQLIEAMRHATLAGGKRLRPFLLLESARLFGAEQPGHRRAAAAVELIHCYSLVHDDLPAMDDDDLRRGRPTVHRAFDEATAILAGDSLLTLAFDVLADEGTERDPAIRAELVLTLARAAGLGGMAGGQMLDLAAEGRFSADHAPLALDEAEILRLQAMKTGALLTASAEMGAIIGRAPHEGRTALRAYGHALGQAFQIADDLLDVESDTKTLGKATGKDSGKGKATLVGLWGIEAARKRLAQLVEQAEVALAGFGDNATVLRHAARFVAARKS